MKRIIWILLKIMLVAVVLTVAVSGVIIVIGNGYVLLQQTVSPDAMMVITPTILGALVVTMATLIVLVGEKSEKSEKASISDA